jgi:hypothetical protein
LVHIAGGNVYQKTEPKITDLQHSRQFNQLAIYERNRCFLRNKYNSMPKCYSKLFYNNHSNIKMMNNSLIFT